jgi:hypothetical protein
MTALALAAMIGLTASAARAEDDDDHVGPHKGPVAEWGDEEYHLEVVPDAKTGDVTIYVYGNHQELHKKKMRAIDSKTLTIALKTTDPATIVKLEPKPSKDDPAGRSTVFVGKNDAFKTDKKISGTVSGKVGTKPYSGDFKQK